MSEQRFEVLVVGSGVMGSSIAYHLARKGLQVGVIERSTIIAVEPVASWASAGGVRRQGRHPAEARLAIEAIERWKNLEQELDADLQYRRGGNLLLAETDQEGAQLIDFVHQQHANGFTDVRLVDRQQLRGLVVGLAEHVVAGSYSPQDGQADPASTTRAFAVAAQLHGAIYRLGTEVQSIFMEGERVNGVRTRDSVVYAQQVVLAAGAWSNELVAALGLQLPIRMVALQMLLSTPAHPGILQPVLSPMARSLSLKQRPDGTFLLGGGWTGEVTEDRQHYRMVAANEQGNWQVACDLLPAVAQQRMARSWCGLEAISIDEIPFVGSLAGLEGLTIATGFSGHGFAISPAVGRCIADQIVGLPTQELDGLKPDRIASFAPEKVAAFKRGDHHAWEHHTG